MDDSKQFIRTKTITPLIWFCLLMATTVTISTSDIRLLAKAQCNFADSCNSVSLSSSTVSASCQTADGCCYVVSQLDLDSHVGNNNGGLQCSSSSSAYSSTCAAMSLGGSVLTGNCLTDDGSYTQASLDLNGCISNNDGTLTWCT